MPIKILNCWRYVVDVRPQNSWKIFKYFFCCWQKVLKSEIECGWNGASKNVKIAVSALIVCVVLTLWF